MHGYLLLVILAMSGKIEMELGGLRLGAASAEVLKPSDVVAWADEVFLLDRADNRIKRFDRQGTLLSVFGRTGQGPGEFLRPVKMAVYGGVLWVFDSEKGLVNRYDRSGTFLGSIKLMRGYDIVFYRDGMVVSDLVNPFLFHDFDLTGRLRRSFAEGFTGTTDFNKALALECRTVVDERHGVLLAFYTHGRYVDRYDLASGALIKRVTLSYGAFAGEARMHNRFEGNGGPGVFAKSGGEPLRAAVVQDGTIWLLLNDENNQETSYLAALDLMVQPQALQKTADYWTGLIGGGALIALANLDRETVQQCRLRIKGGVK